MAVKCGKTVITAAVCLLPLACVASADSAPNAEELEGMLARDLAASTATLGKRIEACEEKASTRDVPTLDAEKVSELSAGREQLLTGLSHLHFRNSFECARDSRETVAFQLGMLEMVHDELGGEADKSRQVRGGLIYPSLEELRYRRKYEKLPEKLRLYLESEVGDEPFTLMKTLEKNNLLVDQ